MVSLPWWFHYRDGLVIEVVLLAGWSHNRGCLIIGWAHYRVVSVSGKFHYRDGLKVGFTALYLRRKNGVIFIHYHNVRKKTIYFCYGNFLSNKDMSYEID